MTAHFDNNSALAELEGLLDIWGAEPARWPPAAKTRIERLMAQEPGGRALLADARALDRLMDQARDAPMVLPRSAARSLADRIAAAAEAPANTATARPESTVGAHVVPFARTAAKPAGRPAVRPSVRPAASSQQWQTAALMAASLLAGIYIGGSVNLAPVMQELAEVAGLSTIVDPTVSDDLGEDDTP